MPGWTRSVIQFSRGRLCDVDRKCCICGERIGLDVLYGSCTTKSRKYGKISFPSTSLVFHKSCYEGNRKGANSEPR